MADLLKQFGIHWQLLIAQIINVGILFLVLRALVWRPILAALDARRKRVEASLTAAEVNDAKVQALEREIAAKRAALHAEVEQTIAHSRELAEQEAHQIVSQAELEATRIRSEVKLHLEQERAALHAQVRDAVVTLTIAATRKLLAREVDAASAAHAVDETVGTLEALPTSR